MLVPIYILVLGFMPKHAIPLSNVTVFGGAVANTLRNVSKRHPNADRPLIDWDLILVMEPSTLAGALIGANLNKILSETVIAVMLVLLLSFTAYSTLKKAMTLYKKETVELMKKSVRKLGKVLCHDEEAMACGSYDMEMSASAEMGSSVPKSNAVMKDDSDAKSTALLHNSIVIDEQRSDHHLPEASVGDHTSSASRVISVQEDDDNDKYYEGMGDNGPEHVHSFELQQILDEERHPNKKKISLIVTMFVVVLTINILKGGGEFQPLGIQCGSTAFWAAQVLLIYWIVMIAAIAREILLKDAIRKAAAGYSPLPEDVKWDERSTVVYPLISTMSGFCAGMFGIGGGIIKGPLMLAMGVHPLVASATSSCMIFFTSFTATTTFALYGLLVTDYAVICLLLGFLSTLVGQTVMDFVLRSKRNSYIAFSIGLVVLLSAVLMTLQSVMHLLSEVADEEEMSGICETDAV